ncbi:MAG: hypothetical protein HYT03_02695 [Candidatus Harrisonbacteria bacterium]|nr:hypothetical protein [Candidatus Harrisonbacteria bacterium]
MKDATLAQGNQVLNLILQKQTPAKQLQDLLESGLLSDLLCANLQGVNREEFRRVCGHKAVTAPGGGRYLSLDWDGFE